MIIIQIIKIKMNDIMVKNPLSDDQDDDEVIEENDNHAD